MPDVEVGTKAVLFLDEAQVMSRGNVRCVSAIAITMSRRGRAV